MANADYPAALDGMLAAWNEKDPGKVRAHLEEAVAQDVHFVDPSIDLHGIDAFEQNVYEVQKQLPGAVYSRVSDVDAQHDHYRYHWAIHQEGNLVVQGFDVTEVRDGKAVKVTGFFGDLPLNQSL